MFKFHGNFIGYEHASKTTDFNGQDDLELYNKNVNKMPDDWYYKNKEITYKFNEFGHRSPDIKDINLNDYILFAGCSHTEGTGLELEKTYVHLLSKKINKDYYNLSVGGSGIDVLFYNLNIWAQKMPKPKLLILQWTDVTRFVIKKPENLFFPRGLWNNTNDEYSDFVASGSIIGYFDTRLYIFYKMLELIFKDIPIINLSFIDYNYHFNYESFNSIDYARDNAHPGIKTNAMVAERLYQKYVDKYLNERFTDDIRGQKQS